MFHLNGDQQLENLKMNIIQDSRSFNAILELNTFGNRDIFRNVDWRAINGTSFCTKNGIKLLD